MPPQPTTDEVLAIRAYRMLSNGMGGFDLGAGLDTVIDLLGVEDVDLLIHRMEAIKYHEAPGRGGDTVQDAG